jgi:hypothetical protein
MKAKVKDYLQVLEKEFKLIPEEKREKLISLGGDILKKNKV